jgi:hypothetical protein
LTPPARTRALAASGAVLVTLTVAAVAFDMPGADGVGTASRDRVLACMIVACALYGATAWAALRWGLPRRSVWLVLAVAFAMRVPWLMAPPFLSTDLYRYIWDGRVQAAGINPYRYVPADPALADLRDDTVYPRINRRDYAPTIYPPAAQIVFAAVARVAQTPLAMKAAMVGFEAVAVLALMRLLRATGRPAAQVLIYAWNPLAAEVFAGNGHVDAAAIAAVALCLLAASRGRRGLAGAALGAAVLVKFLPAVIAPALWARGRWRTALAAGAVVIALYALYASVGLRVFGFLGGYAGEEGLSGSAGQTVPGPWPLAVIADLVDLPAWAGPAYLLGAACVLGGLGWRIAFRHDGATMLRDAATLAFATMLLLTPHYAWYYVWLAALATLAPSAALIWLSAAPVLLYPDPFADRAAWTALIYVPAILLAANDMRRRAAAPVMSVIQRSA